MSKQEFLFEIYSEEIPARMGVQAALQLKSLFEREITKKGIKFSCINTHFTPLRLVLTAENLSLDESISAEKRGPKVGANVAAIEGFAKSLGLKKEKLYTKIIDGNEYYFGAPNISDKEEGINKALKTVIEKIFHEFSWPKSMRWDASGVTWVRPIRNILCIYGSEVISVKFGTTTSNNITFGHRLISYKKAKISSVAQYKKFLKDNSVILDHEQRKSLILESLNEICKKHKLELIRSDDLLEEVAGLVEFPVPILGQIDKRFIQLPEEVLIVAMRKHQRFFSFRNDKGDFAPYFVTIANNITDDSGKTITLGNEKVLKARLFDAKFFFEEDKKSTLESRAHRLSNLIFHDRLGSVLAKTERVAELAQKYVSTNKVAVRRGALLSKADLTTQLTCEFPELQGIAGSYYALHDKEDKLVASIIKEHYMPISREGALPSSKEAAIVSLADKLDSLVGLFLVDEIPTSSQDPFALRRSALGIIRIILHYGFEFNIRDMVKSSMSLYAAHEHGGNERKIYDFLYERFRYFLKNDYSSGMIAAVLNTSNGEMFFDFKKLQALDEFIKSSHGETVLSAIKRISNIVRAQNLVIDDVNQDLFTQKEERTLFENTLKLQEKLITFTDKHDYQGAFKLLAGFTNAIDLFFDNVMVMSEDKLVATNRLALMNKINRIFSNLVDFSNI